MGILLALVAGMFVPITNFCVKKSVDITGSAKGFFVLQMAASCFFAILLGPVRTGDFQIAQGAVILGTVAGLMVAGLLYTLGRAVEKGPPGFTFAILNSATVMPGLIMSLLFGASLGYIYNFWHALGSFLVIAGLFWGGMGLQGMKEMKLWVFFVSLTFACHVCLLSLYQWKAMLANHPEVFRFFTPDEIKNEWFAPCMFFSSGLIQLMIYLKSGLRMKGGSEIFYGISGGVSNLFCTFFIIWAAEVANPLENAVIFPIFSVVGIMLTNLWGQKLYQENVNWRACQISLFGLVIGTVNWKAIAGAMGI